MSSPVALILGAGPRTGRGLAQTLAQAGYQVAVTSRREDDHGVAKLVVSAEFSNPSAVTAVFKEVREKLGEPQLVIYNAATYTQTNPADPFKADVAGISNDMAVNVTSAYAAMQEAVASFELSKAGDGNKAFFFVGNAQNNFPLIVPLFTLGAGKCAAAHIVQVGAATYGKEGYGFYYLDERSEDSTPLYANVDGAAHARFILGLVKEPHLGDWYQTFAKEKGRITVPAYDLYTKV